VVLQDATSGGETRKPPTDKWKKEMDRKMDGNWNENNYYKRVA